MSSRVLYPPIVDSQIPAFQAGEGSVCTVYFSLSKFNGSSDFKNLHISVTKQSNGLNVVKPTDELVMEETEDNKVMHYRSTGIILNANFYKVEGTDNLYYTKIYNEDINGQDGEVGNKNYNGWIPGWIYKIQIRLSAAEYDGSIGQAKWLHDHASDFSEWSTIAIVKAVGRIDLIIPPLGYNSSNENENGNGAEIVNTLYLSTLDFFGKIDSVEDASEVLYKYNLKLFDEIEELIEDSGELYSSQYQNSNNFQYLCKHEFKDNESGTLIFTYTTNNGFTSTFKYRFLISLLAINEAPCTILTLENDNINKDIAKISSLEMEEEEGRVALKLFVNGEVASDLYNGNICIRRSSSKSGFTEWEDIKIYVVTQTLINNLPPIYDYTIESGVYYKYGVQAIDKYGNRGTLDIPKNMVMRNFEYSYLLGENNQQLKLMFNNTMPNYKIQLMESKTETIGSTYPIVTRNAALRYKLFPINGLISFWMDENHLFCNKRVIYDNQDDVIQEYNNYNNRTILPYSTEHHHDPEFAGDSPSYEDITLESVSNITGLNEPNYQPQYDYIYERDFRKMVLDFLHDGKPKLFKSPTEGNVIVRLTEINCVPNQTLDRMIYEFSSTANELADNTYDNYIKYKFLIPGNWSSEFYTTETKIGQLKMDFAPMTNIISEIFKKYDTTGQNYAGYRKIIQKIHHLKITINSDPIKIVNLARQAITGSDYVIGNNIIYNGNMTITMYAPQRIYEFDERLNFYSPDITSICFEGEHYTEEEKNEILKYNPTYNFNKPINATIDFLYDQRLETYEKKQIQSQQTTHGIGQIFGQYRVDPKHSISKDIFAKYKIDWDREFRELDSISSIEIEANPGAVFRVTEKSNIVSETNIHEINDTGVLRMEDMNKIGKIEYLGMRNPATGEIDETIPVDLLLNYHYILKKGTYKGVQV